MVFTRFRPYDALRECGRAGLAAGGGSPALVLGMVAALMKRPWWWAAIVAVVVAMVAAIAPTPEPAESRLVAGDLPFLLIVAAVVSGLVWLGWFARRRLRRRSDAAPDQEPRPSKTS
jgi:type VI protein secretion system component VasK